ncbi:hypothetical protein DFO54_104118 [Erwinia sp. AG740]|nr:hypothetical protein DFO54_104118 [Erwinia sp. AG740]
MALFQCPINKTNKNSMLILDMISNLTPSILKSPRTIISILPKRAIHF